MSLSTGRRAAGLASAALLMLCGCAGLADRTTAPVPQSARERPDRFVVVTVRNPLVAPPAHAASGPRGYDAAPQYGIGAAASAAARGIARDYGMQLVSAWPIASLGVHCVLYGVPQGSDAALARLRQDTRVESLQSLNHFEGLAAAQSSHEATEWMPYNDPYGKLQHALQELAVVPAQQRTRGAGVRVAVIDTGVDLAHPDLASRIDLHRDFVDGAGVPFPPERHGTEVAGVIGALADNGVGIVGIAPEARLLVLRACWQPGGSTRSVCDSFTLAQALEAAIAARADVVNMSLSGPPDPLLERLIQAGQRQGIIFVAAVPPEGGAGFPATLQGVLAVAAAEDPLPRSGGVLAAPGRDILTLVPGGHYDFASGSSMAAAEVTGVVSLLLAQHHRLGVAQLREALTRSASGDGAHAGRSVNACAALGWLLSAEVCGAPDPRAALLRSPATRR